MDILNSSVQKTTLTLLHPSLPTFTISVEAMPYIHLLQPEILDSPSPVFFHNPNPVSIRYNSDSAFKIEVES